MRGGLFIAILPLALGCGPDPGAVHSAGEDGTAGGSGGVRGPAPGAGAYAPSPITPFAREMTALALAAASGRALPETRLALGPEEGERVRGLDGEGSGSDLEPVAFLLRLDLRLAPAPGEGERRWVRVAAALTSAGVRLLSVAPRALGPSTARPPEELGDLGVFVGQILRGGAGGWPRLSRLGEGDRAMLGDVAFDALADLWVDPPDTLPRDRAVDGVRIADLAILARRPSGDPALMELEVRTADAGFILRGAPLVELSPVRANHSSH